jgi:tetratricopeptide (TPR) repeat protein
MKVPGLGFALLLFGSIALAQEPSGTGFKLVLSDHPGQLTWTADGFKIVQSSAKPGGRELGIRGRDNSGRLTFLGFLFLVPERAPLTSAKCREDALEQEKKGNPSLTILRTSEVRRSSGPPLSLATYTTKARDGSVGYMVRGFAATGDICGDLEFYSGQAISAEDADLTRSFLSFRLDPDYVPKFADVAFYAQVLYQTQMYQAAGPAFEKALALLPQDGSPFPSARIARRVMTDQAGMAYGISGDLRKARSVFETGIASDPEYPLYYYNLACTDAGEKNLTGARLHLQEAFARKTNLNSGETMPDPTMDDSFLPYKENREFWSFVQSLQSGK